MGPKFHMPIGKIIIECLHEVLQHVIMHHSLMEPKWEFCCTNDVKKCLDFILEFKEISASPICNELGMFLETCMAILNRQDYRKIISENIDLFQNILDNLQLNPSNRFMSKCTVFKLPAAPSMFIRHKTTTYYVFIEIANMTNSPKILYNFIDSDLRQSK